MRPDLLSWFAPSMLEPSLDAQGAPPEFERLWRGFMTARVTLGLVLLLLQGSILFLGASQDSTPFLVSLGYFGAAMATRLVGYPRPPRPTLDVQWISTLGTDILTFITLQIIQGSSINYAPLFMLPVLMASVLGSMLLAMGASATVTLMLFIYAGWLAAHGQGDATSHFMQAALTGAGCFAISLLAHQIATRLANVELLAKHSELAVRVQRQVNEMVIESLTDGILVLDQNGLVRAANPAARLLLRSKPSVDAGTFDLTSTFGWASLVDIMKLSFFSLAGQRADITLRHAGMGPQRLHVRTQLTAINNWSGETLCVMFLQDQRELEARMRSEKMASMGRMSAAVAHEIRNPLAAITQANSLLDEDLSEPRHKQLTRMVQQNAKRLGKIAEEVLDISRVQQRDHDPAAFVIEMNSSVARICQEWQTQVRKEDSPGLDLSSNHIYICFDEEHLRRILFNLLDNALRYASQQLNAVQVRTSRATTLDGALSVWSDGQPMEQSVERHLFEPFFSSESRSSGLGLYICRELCERYDASITYHRTERSVAGKLVEGNEFLVQFRTSSKASDINTKDTGSPIAPWLKTPQ